MEFSINKFFVKDVLEFQKKNYYDIIVNVI
jgi:hypothetical protein